jgi:hypothetical protein
LDFESPRSTLGAIDSVMDMVSLVVAVITNVCCIYLVPVMIYWVFRLRKTSNFMRLMFLKAAILESAIWHWTATQIWMLVVWDMTLPLATLANRIEFMAAVVFHTVIAMHYYGVPRRTPMPMDP